MSNLRGIIGLIAVVIMAVAAFFVIGADHRTIARDQAIITSLQLGGSFTVSATGSTYGIPGLSQSQYTADLKPTTALTAAEVDERITAALQKAGFSVDALQTDLLEGSRGRDRVEAHLTEGASSANTPTGYVQSVRLTVTQN